MVALSTVVIDRNGDRVVINRVDYDPKTHKLWSEKEKKVVEKKEKTTTPVKLNKKASKEDA